MVKSLNFWLEVERMNWSDISHSEPVVRIEPQRVSQHLYENDERRSRENALKVISKPEYRKMLNHFFSGDYLTIVEHIHEELVVGPVFVLVLIVLVFREHVIRKNYEAQRHSSLLQQSLIYHRNNRRQSLSLLQSSCEEMILNIFEINIFDSVAMS